MGQNAKNGLGVVRESFKYWTALIIYIGSLVFAFFVIAITLQQRISPLLLVSAGILGSLINFFLYKKFPQRFYLWDGFPKKQWFKKATLQSFFAFPPLSVFVMSIALFVFVGSFLNSSFQSAWQKSLIMLPDAAEIIAIHYLLYVILAVLLFGPPILFILYFMEKFRESQKRNFILIISIPLSVGYIILLAQLMSTYGLFGINVDEAKRLMTQLTISLIGFVPLHWFFEIFIGSIFPKAHSLNILKNLLIKRSV